jgi:hypothetical protein
MATQLYPQRFNHGDNSVALAYNNTTTGQNIYIQPGPVLVYRIIFLALTAITTGTSGTLTVGVYDGSTLIGSANFIAGTDGADAYHYAELTTPVAVDASGTGVLTVKVISNTGVTGGTVRAIVQYL